MNKKNPLIIELEANLIGNDYVIGDLHGCYDELMALLKFVNFNKEYDRIFCVGDLVHRGPKSIDCLNLLKEKNKNGENWFFSTLGNHEPFYKKGLNNNKNIDLNNYQEEIDKLPYIYVINHLIYGKFYIVHAEINYEILFGENVEINPIIKINNIIDNDYSKEIKSLLNVNKKIIISEEQKKELIWSRKIFKYFSNKNQINITMGDFDFIDNTSSENIKIFCGHNVVPFPLKIGQQIYCDTGACFGYIDDERMKKAFSKWGNKFYSLSLIDINMGKVHTCLTSEESLNIEQKNNITPIYKRGDILTMNVNLFKNILEYRKEE